MPLDLLPDVTPAAAPPAAAGALQRARGRAAVAFRSVEGTTRLARLYQEGQAKIRLPKVHGGGAPVAVLINTAGGVTGGDRLTYEAAWGAGAHATVTSQAAERIYRAAADDVPGRLDVSLAVGPEATAEWLPQETILFDRARLERRLDVSIDAGSRLLMAETVVFGRTAMGERVRSASLADHWRIRRNGRLVFADSFAIAGDVERQLAGRATGGGAVASTMLIFAAPAAADRLDGLRTLLQDAEAAGPVEAGATALDGLLVARLVSGSAQALRGALVRVLEEFRAAPLPRVWSC